MAISLASTALGSPISLPDGLIWSDELEWESIEQETSIVNGDLVVVRRPAISTGRPITLLGGRSGRTSWAWMTRTNVLALRSALDTTAATLTLTLHDARSFTVVPNTEVGALIARPLPRVGERAPADPSATWWYVIDQIAFLTR